MNKVTVYLPNSQFSDDIKCPKIKFIICDHMHWVFPHFCKYDVDHNQFMIWFLQSGIINIGTFFANGSLGKGHRFPRVPCPFYFAHQTYDKNSQRVLSSQVRIIIIIYSQAKWLLTASNIG